MCGRFVSARKRLELLEEFAATRDAVGADRDPDYNVAPTKRIYAVIAERPETAGSAPASAGPEDGGGPTTATTGDVPGAAGAIPGRSPGEGVTEDGGGAPFSLGEGLPHARGGHRGDGPRGRCRELRLVRWGLVPVWAKDTSGGARMINARSETVAVKPAFRSAFAKRRCLIPADGYYEWVTEGKAKKPFYIYRADGGILAFAGIYELWRNSLVPDDHEDAWYWSASIITTQATDDIGRIHDRTPMTIAPENWTDWLDPANREKELLLATMRPAMLSGAGGLAAHPVSTAVNSVRNNGPSLIEPLGEAVPPVGDPMLPSAAPPTSPPPGSSLF
jgi:putative SOS response-associated peptidase YedK